LIGWLLSLTDIGKQEYSRGDQDENPTQTKMPSSSGPHERIVPGCFAIAIQK
jgi:hypothetical protein